MHIPDGFLDTRTAVATYAVSAAGVGYALARLKKSLAPHRLPLIGLSTAFIFAAQMLNFPVAGGTSGHLIGAVLAAVLVGPSAAVLVMSSVLILQCFLFADGGVTALGANVFNMALLAPLFGYLVFRSVKALLGGTERAALAAAAFAAWCSTLAASLACTGQLALSGTVNWSAALPAMAGVHMLIGLGEAAITTLVIAALARLRPELMQPESQPSCSGLREAIGYGLVLCLGAVIFIAPFASPWPDGLERVADNLGFAARAADPILTSPLPDYTIPGLNSPLLSTAVAGAVGTLVAFLFALFLARRLSPGRVKPQ